MPRSGDEMADAALNKEEQRARPASRQAAEHLFSRKQSIALIRVVCHVTAGSECLPEPGYTEAESEDAHATAPASIQSVGLGYATLHQI
jgi:hypothetical protein